MLGRVSSPILTFRLELWCDCIISSTRFKCVRTHRAYHHAGEVRAKFTVAGSVIFGQIQQKHVRNKNKSIESYLVLMTAWEPIIKWARLTLVASLKALLHPRCDFSLVPTERRRKTQQKQTTHKCARTQASSSCDIDNKQVRCSCTMYSSRLA